LERINAFKEQGAAIDDQVCLACFSLFKLVPFFGQTAQLIVFSAAWLDLTPYII